MKILKLAGGIALGYLIVKGVQAAIKIQKMHEEDPELAEAKELYQKAGEHYRDTLTEKLQEEKNRKKKELQEKIKDMKEKAVETVEGGVL